MVKHLVPKAVVVGSLVFSSLFLLSGCTPRPEIAPYSNLLDLGLLPVSTTNPYLGANLFLGGEAQRSGYLLNFLKARGGPVAIALESSNFGDTSLLMYYPKNREIYRAELQVMERGAVEVSEWLVRGPYAISRRDYRELGRLDGSLVGEPIFLIRGKQVKFGQQGSTVNPLPANSSTAAIIAPAPNTEQVIVPIVPKPKKAAPKKKTTPVSKPVEAETKPEVPLNSDQQALQSVRGLVERNPAGDAIHIVVSDKQDLKKLAEWYTGNASNAGAVAEASGLEAGKEPPLASRVIIPKAILKNDKRLTE